MSQHNIKCPKCGHTHEVDAFRSGGEAKALASVSNPNCNFFTDNPAEIHKLLGLEEVHRQRVANHEMPRFDE